MTSGQHSPTWYDLLGVSPDATSEEIRTAWRTGIADLEPGDRRFETRNRAASVLLDPQQRAAYDASLGEAGTDTAPSDQLPPTHQEPAAEKPKKRDKRAKRDRAPRQARSLPTVPTWLLAALTLLAVVMVAGTVIVWQTQDEEAAAAPAEDVRAAQTAAERAVVPVVSYSFQTLEEDRSDAEGYLTEDYREEYDKLFTVIEDNAPETETTVQAKVVSSGIVRSGEDRVDVLVFVDRPTTNRLNPEPVVYRDQVTLSMVRSGEEWLVADMKTSPTPG